MRTDPRRHHMKVDCGINYWTQEPEQFPDTEAVIMYDIDMNRSTMTLAQYRDRCAKSYKKIYMIKLKR